MSKHGIIGDSFITDIPETKVEESQLNEEKKLARFSKTAEYKRLKGYLEERIKFYQSFLPDGRSLHGLNKQELGEKWPIANAIIGELKTIIETYEGANEVVREYGRKDDKRV